MNLDIWTIQETLITAYFSKLQYCPTWTTCWWQVISYSFSIECSTYLSTHTDSGAQMDAVPAWFYPHYLTFAKRNILTTSTLLHLAHFQNCALHFKTNALLTKSISSFLKRNIFTAPNTATVVMQSSPGAANRVHQSLPLREPRTTQISIVEQQCLGKTKIQQSLSSSVSNSWAFPERSALATRFPLNVFFLWLTKQPEYEKNDLSHVQKNWNIHAKCQESHFE